MTPITVDGKVVGKVVEVIQDKTGIIVQMELFKEQDLMAVISELQPVSFRFQIKDKDEDVSIQ